MTVCLSDVESSYLLASTQVKSEMATPQKHKSEDMNVSEMSACSCATVHGVFINDVSPVKCSRTNPDVKYFLGQFTDSKKAVRMVSFEPKLRNEVQKAQESGEVVASTVVQRLFL